MISIIHYNNSKETEPLVSFDEPLILERELIRYLNIVRVLKHFFELFFNKKDGGLVLNITLEARA